MDIFDELIKRWNLDMIIVSIVFLSGFAQERFLEHWHIVKDSRLCAALKTLILSLGVSTIYIVLSYKQLKNGSDGAEVLVPWGKYFISFFTATSVYDLVIRPIRKWIAKKTGDAEASPIDNNKN